MRRTPGEPELPFAADSGSAVAWAAEQAGWRRQAMWDIFEAFRRAYARHKPPWDEMGSRYMFELWVAYFAHWLAGEEIDMREYISAQHNLAPEPDFGPESEGG